MKRSTVGSASFKHAQSCGQSAAVRSGGPAARAIVATLDGDGQNNPAFLPDLIDGESRRRRVGATCGRHSGSAARTAGFKKFQSSDRRARRARAQS